MSRFGVPGQNTDPLAYADGRLSTVPVVNAPRRPTTSDKKYPIWCEWRVNKNATAPALEGEFWKLVKFETNGDATWVQLDTGGGGPGVDDLRDQVNVRVTPSVIGDIDIDGSVVANAANPSGIPLETVADPATTTLDLQLQVATERTGAPGDKNDAGICSFDDTVFAVDADGYVTLGSGPGPLVDSVDIDFSTVPGTDPVLPTAGGQISINGNTVNNATNSNSPVATHSRAANSFDIDVQVATGLAGAPADPFDAGLASFDNTSFTVAPSGYVTLIGGAGPAAQDIDVDFNTGPGTDPVVPTAGGVISVFGNTVTNATNANAPVATHSRAANQLHVDVQLATAVTGAPGDPFDAGLCSFDDTAFAVDANGYVTLAGGSGPAVDQVAVDANTGPGTDPVLASATGEITVAGAAVAAHSVPVETHSRAANAYNIEVQVATERAGAPGDKNDAGLSSYDEVDFVVDTDGFVTRNSATLMKPNYVQNLGIAYDGGTGVFTVQGATAALSTANPAFIVLPSQATPGLMVLYEITANVSFIDDNGASEIVGNLFGHTTGRATDQDIPFFIYAVPNDAENAISFMIARVSHKTVSPAAANIGAPDDAVADAQSDFWAMDNLDETLYDDNPCLCIGCFRMRMSASDDWTVQTLDDEIDGIGKFFESHYFTQAKGHYSADASSYWIAGAGTVPAWTSESLQYTVQRDGTCHWDVGFSGDGGTDGSGAVAAQFVSPFYGPNVDFHGLIITQPAGQALASMVHTSTNRRVMEIRNAATFNYGAFGNGNRQFSSQANFRILDG